MSALTSIAIPRPRDWQAFERAAVELWICLLGDDGIHRFGRQGQAQFGLDLLGYRDLDAAKLVGIQCKCVRDLDEKLIREEVDRALKYKPEMTEYYVVTTADDSTAFAELGFELTDECRRKGGRTVIRIWGWSTLEDRIQKHTNAHKAFDPNYTPVLQAVIDRVTDQLDHSSVQQAEIRSDLSEVKTLFKEHIAQRNVVDSDAPKPDDAYSAELTRYRDLMNKGRARTALELVQDFERTLPNDASGSLRCRVKSLQGHCFRMLGDFESAIAQFDSATALAPEDQRGKTALLVSTFLKGDYELALELGQKALADDETDEASMTWMAFAASRVDRDVNLHELVPEKLRETQAFAEANLDYLRGRDRVPDWWDAARLGAKAFPTSRILRSAAADSQLDECQAKTPVNETGELTAEWRERLLGAADALENELTEIYKSETPNRLDGATIALNATAVFAVLRQLDDAKRILSEALDHYPTDEGIVLRAAQVAANTGDVALQNRCLPHLGFDGQALHARIQILDHQNRWQELADLGTKYPLPSHVGTARIPSQVMVKCAQIRVAPPMKAARRLKRLIETYPDAGSDLVVAINVANDLNRPDLADEAFAKAYKSIDADAHIVQRVNVAIAANSRADWQASINVLSGHVHSIQDSFELRLLARAHGSQFPVSVRSAEFFDQLDPAVRDSYYYKSLEAHLRYNSGDLDKAELLTRELIAERPEDIGYLAVLAFTLKRLDRSADLVTLMNDVKPSELVGTPMEKMQIAHFLVDYGRPLDGVDLGYRQVLQNPNDADLTLKNLGLIFNKPPGQVELPIPTCVEDRTFVKLKSSEGLVDEFIVDSTLPDGIRDVCKPDSERLRGTLGMKIDDQTIVELPFDGEQVWTVVEIKSCYLHVVHDTIANFNKRFPHHKGFQNFEVRDDDVSQIMEVVKKSGSKTATFETLYRETPLPISIFGAANGTATLKLFEYLETSDLGVITCIGRGDERSAAMSKVGRHIDGRVALDTTAFWTVCNLDAWDVLEGVFKEIFVPQSLVEDLRELRDDVASYLGTNSGTLANIDGQFYYTENDDAEISRRVGVLEDRLAQIEARTTPDPALVPAQADQLARQLLLQVKRADLLDPVFVSLNRDALLVTEDQRYAVVAEGMFNCQAVWLQAIFSAALRRGVIDLGRYASLSGQLAMRKHGYTSFDANTLLRLANDDDDLFLAAISYIGNVDGDLFSHLGVVRSFIATAWRDSIPALKVQWATGKLLERLARLFNERTSQMVLILSTQFSGAQFIREYLYRWGRGHFMKLEDGDGEAARRFIREERAKLSATRAVPRVLKAQASRLPIRK